MIVSAPVYCPLGPALAPGTPSVADVVGRFGALPPQAASTGRASVAGAPIAMICNSTPRELENIKRSLDNRRL